jgi:hypothetical protein
MQLFSSAQLCSSKGPLSLCLPCLGVEWVGLMKSGQFQGLPEVILSCLSSCLRNFLKDGMLYSLRKLLHNCYMCACVCVCVCVCVVTYVWIILGFEPLSDISRHRAHVHGCHVTDFSWSDHTHTHTHTHLFNPKREARTILVRVFIAVMKHHDQKQVGEERVYLAYASI